jgi:hypothetical protein
MPTACNRPRVLSRPASPTRLAGGRGYVGCSERLADISRRQDKELIQMNTRTIAILALVIAVVVVLLLVF